MTVAGLGLAGVSLPGVRVVAAAAGPERRGLMVSIYVSAYYFGAALSLWASGTLLADSGWLGPLGWRPLLLIGCLYGLLLAADSSIYSATVTEVAPPDQLGSAQAAQAFTASVPSSAARVAAGLVLDLGGGYGSAFGLAGGVAITGALNEPMAPGSQRSGQQDLSARAQELMATILAAQQREIAQMEDWRDAWFGPHSH
jgi:MFS family permease